MVDGKAEYDYCHYVNRSYENLPESFEEAYSTVFASAHSNNLLPCQKWSYNTTKDMQLTAIIQVDIGILLLKVMYLFKMVIICVSV